MSRWRCATRTRACRLFGRGETATQVNEQMSAKVGASMADTLQLTSSAILAYPNCFKGGDRV